MRLINTKTVKLTEFHSSQIPSYVILSHMWSNGEVSLQEFQDADPAITERPGYLKIVKYVEIARQSGYQWAWIDTCSIDKSSSADLSEAINSMFTWYRNANECIVYLSDVDCTEGLDIASFRKSRWFTRGWTLQELIAPAEITFFDCNWKPFGSKTGNLTRFGCFPELVDIISSVTSIDMKLLKRDPYSGLTALLSSYSVAERMSWAAGRVTTREEDRAYSLLGLFSINMPLLYGEGKNAFIRLQEEIIKEIDDQSVFAWGFKQPVSGTKSDIGVLARSPDGFKHSADIVPFRPRATSAPARVTSRGINLDALLCRFGNRPYVVLECRQKNEKSSMLAIRVESSGLFYTRCIESRIVPFDELIGISAQTIVLAKEAGRHQVQDEYWTRKCTFVFDFNSLGNEYRPKMFFPETKSLSQKVYMHMSNHLSFGIIGILFENSDLSLPAFRVIAASRTSSGSSVDDKNRLEAVSIVSFPQSQTLASSGATDAVSGLELQSMVQEKLNERSRLSVHMSYLSKSLVLAVEHSITDLFDHPLVLVKVEIISIPDMMDRYQEIKNKILDLSISGSVTAKLMLMNLTAEEYKYRLSLDVGS